MFKSIKSKFIFFSLLFIVGSVIVSSLLLVNQLKKNYEHQTLIMVESTLDVLKTGFNDAMLMGKPKNIQDVLTNVAINNNIDHIRVINKKGTILHSSNKDEKDKKLKLVSPEHVNIDELNKRNINIIETKNMYSAVEPIFNRRECRGCHQEGNIIAYLDVDTNMASINESFFTGVPFIVAVSGIVVLLLTLSFYKVFDNFINKPIDRFNNAMNDVQGENLDVRLPAEKEDEFGTLEKHFNKMVSNLKESREKIEELHFEQIQRADKLITMGELTAQVAHEINNHSAIIMSRADYLQMESVNNPALRNYTEDFDVIVKQIGNVSQITGSILKHSKKIDKNYLEFDLKNVINDSLVMLGPTVKKKNIELIKEFNTHNNYIFGDPIQVEQAIINLINNAVDAITNDKGKITVSLSEESKNQLNLSITDNGSGIKDENLDQIFSPFFTTKETGKGTGLGLHIVNTICKNHNANIDCFSEPGKGTTFKIIFNREA